MTKCTCPTYQLREVGCDCGISNERAEEMCRQYLADDGSDDLSHLTQRDINKWCNRVANAASQLMESGDQDQYEVGARVLKVAPGLWDYDRLGNYCGFIANENGWTP